MIITIQHCRECGLCARGVRRFCETHDIDFRDFLENGIEEEVALATGEGFVEMIVEHAHGQQ